jgi:hypothetical protein
MATDSIILRADEADYHSDNGLAKARRNVRIQLLPREPHLSGAMVNWGNYHHPFSRTRIQHARAALRKSVALRAAVQARTEPTA